MGGAGPIGKLKFDLLKYLFRFSFLNSPKHPKRHLLPPKHPTKYHYDHYVVDGGKIIELDTYTNTKANNKRRRRIKEDSTDEEEERKKLEKITVTLDQIKNMI